MKFKLNENFGVRIKKLLTDNGFDAETVSDEKLNGIDDRKLFEICNKEERCLLTLDLDFSDVLVFPPEKSSGIVVFRSSQRLSFQLIEFLVSQFIKNLKVNELKGHLWIIEPNRIRIHQSD